MTKPFNPELLVRQIRSRLAPDTPASNTCNNYLLKTKACGDPSKLFIAGKVNPAFSLALSWRRKQSDFPATPRC